MKNIFTFLQLATLIELAKTDIDTLDCLTNLNDVISKIDFTPPEQMYLNRKKSELLLIYSNL